MTKRTFLELHSPFLKSQSTSLFSFIDLRKIKPVFQKLYSFDISIFSHVDEDDPLLQTTDLLLKRERETRKGHSSERTATKLTICFAKILIETEVKNEYFN